MGQAYCQTCCGEKNVEIYTAMGDHKGSEADLPSSDFAKAVRQLIEIHPKIKQIYSENRVSHLAERRGKKLQLYYLFGYAAYYDGQWENGLPHGFGRLIYDDGSIYEGCFEAGTAECRGALFIKNNGTFYKGEVKANKANGFGVLHSEKFYYKGHWVNDVPHGEGQEVYMKGLLPHYEGNFQKGKKHGHGIYHWNQKEYYAGEFKNNMIHGAGKHVTRDFEYTGTFAEGEKHGSGTLHNIHEKWTYEGEFQKNKMEGEGTFVWEDGTKFEGSFCQSQRKKGKLLLTSGQTVDVDDE